MVFECRYLVTSGISRHARGATCFLLARGRAPPASGAVAPGAAVTAEPVGQAAAREADDLRGDAAVAIAHLADQLRLTRAEVADRHRVPRRPAGSDLRAIGRPWDHVGSPSCPRRTGPLAESSRPP